MFTPSTPAARGVLHPTRRLTAAATSVLAMTAAAAIAWAAPAAAVLPPPVPGAPAVEFAPTSVTGLDPALPAGIQAASAAPSKWTPEKATYGTATDNDITVVGAGGTPIRVNETYPTLANGQPAPGPFPVLLTMTPYGKGTGAGDSYLVERGYIDVVEDVRGTGDSGGSFGLFDPIQTQDAIKVLDWAAKLPNSDGRVGTYGASYLGIDQLLLAGAVGKNSPLKAIFPMVPANDTYRDTSFMGGLLDPEFDLTYIGLTTGLNQANPLPDTLSDSSLLSQLVSLESDHATSIASYDASLIAGILGGGDQAYDQAYWQARAPETTLANVVKNDIPAYIVGGEFDIFQHGEPTNYAALQNVWDHRNMNAAMLPNQKVTGRYQLLVGPWEHTNGSMVDVDPLELEWFDTWLKHETTGMGRTKTPVHYYDLGTGNYQETSTYPFTGATPTKLYLGADHTLSSTAPPLTASTDTLLWSPTGSICGRALDQWSIGVVSIATSEAGILPPCVTNDAPATLLPSQVSYTTAPFTTPETLSGPSNATVYMSANTKDTELVAELEEVTPDDTSFPITEGALDGSLRAVTPGRSWTSKGVTLLPYHPYTQASAQAVTPGQVTEYQVEIFPSLITIPAGDRLRLTISSTDTPHLIPIPQDLLNMVGGIYSINRTAANPSSLSLDLTP